METIFLEMKIPVKRKREEVFSFLSNFSNHKFLYRANIDSRQVSEGPAGVGTKMKNVARFLWLTMEETFVITEFVQDKLIAKESLPGSTITTTDKIILEDHPEGTLITVQCYAELRGIMKWFKGPIERKFRKDVAADWEMNKINFESGKYQTNMVDL